MQDSSAPVKIALPWAANAAAPYITAVPVPSQIGVNPGRASFNDGFPPLNFVPVAAGGVPPFGADMNGALNQTTGGLQWLQAGGPLYWDSVFAAATGGYPKGATVQSNVVQGLFWYSTLDNNTSNPDLGGAGWIALLLPMSQIQFGGYLNKFYNGTCTVAQRGTTIVVSPGTPVYTLDGYIVGCSGASVTVSQAASVGLGANSLQITGQGGVTDVFVIKIIESRDAYALANAPSIFQAKLQNNSGGPIVPTFTVKTAAGGTDIWSSSTTVVSAVNLQNCINGLTAQLSSTWAMPGGSRQGVSVRIDLGGSLNGAGKNVQIGDWDIRVGSAVLLPEMRAFSAELLQAQRYLPGMMPQQAGWVSGGLFDAAQVGGAFLPFFTPTFGPVTGILISAVTDFGVVFRGSIYTASVLTYNGSTHVTGSLNFATTSGSVNANLGEASGLGTMNSNSLLVFTGAEINGIAI